MTPLTCTEAADLIDLHAAFACEPDQVEALTAHLATCPACTASLEEARELQALLDWNALAPAARERLRTAIDSEAKPQRARPVQPMLWARRLGSLAALLLVVLGLSLVLGDSLSSSGSGIVLVAEAPAMSAEMRSRLEMMKVAAAPGQAIKVGIEVDHVPQPRPVDVPFDLHNDSARPVQLLLGNERTRTQLDLDGPGDLRHQPTLVPPEIDLAPGQTAQVTLRGLAVTRPGDYRLRGRLRIEARSPATPTTPEWHGTLTLPLPSLWVQVPPG
jgi:hypothetical protein